MGSTPKTFPLSREMAANTPLMLEKPLRCHVPSRKHSDVISHLIPTRNNKYLLRVPKIKLQSTRKAFYFDGAIKYNKLPLQLRSISERKTFFKKLNDYILTI